MIIIILIHQSLRGLQGRWLIEWSLESDRPESICRCVANWPGGAGQVPPDSTLGLSFLTFKMETRLSERAGCEDGNAVCLAYSSHRPLSLSCSLLFWLKGLKKLLPPACGGLPEAHCSGFIFFPQIFVVGFQ